MKTTENAVRTALKRGVPLVVIRTDDANQTIAAVNEEVRDITDVVVLQWDLCDGSRAWNDAGLAVRERLLKQLWNWQDGQPDPTIRNPLHALRMVKGLPEYSVCFLLGAQALFDDPTVMQGIYNLRDQLKRNHRTLVLLIPDGADVPVSLRPNAIILDAPLADDAALVEIVRRVYSAVAEQVNFDLSDEMAKEVAAQLRGCSAFTAEQVASMTISATSFDREEIFSMTKQAIEQTKGLRIESGSETFEKVRGLDKAVEFGSRLFNGPRRPHVVVRIEELEKAMKGVKGDLSGTSSDIHQVLLSEMEDNGWNGMLAYGPAGSGKSLYAKALGRSFGARVLRLDINATKGSLVGQTEMNIRRAINVIKTIGGRDVFFVASMNKMDIDSPLQRRFRAGVWFFDIPSKEAAEEIWQLHIDEYGIEDTRGDVDYTDFTGADIRNVCEMAAALQCTIAEATEFVTPLRVADPESIDDARQQANHRFLDSQKGGVYRSTRSTVSAEGLREVDLS